MKMLVTPRPGRLGSFALLLAPIGALLLASACTVDPDDSLVSRTPSDSGRSDQGQTRDLGSDPDIEDVAVDLVDQGRSDEPDAIEPDVSFPVARPDCGDAEGLTWFRVETRNGSAKTPLLGSGFLSRTDPSGPEVDLQPGDAYPHDVWAAPGWRLSLACAMPDSNDLFYATPPEGLPLFDEEGTPNLGDVTAAISLWDAGTEANQEIGLGSDQANRQEALDQGDPDPNTAVREAEELASLPPVDELIAVTLSMDPENYFHLVVENVAEAGAISTSEGSLTPTIGHCTYAVHREPGVLFSEGEPAGPGLEELAEFGGAQPFAEVLLPRRGPPSPLGPGLAIVHRDNLPPLFESGVPDRGEGLEDLAEDADPSELLANLADDDGIRCVAEIPAAEPGDWTGFEIAAVPGEHLSFVLPVVEANDYFIGTAPLGFPLFSDASEPASDADLAHVLAVWNLGTEIDEWPAAGVSQSPRQAAPGAGLPEGGSVAAVEVGRWPRLETFVSPSLEPLSE